MDFEEICEKYQTWVIRITSNSLLRPVFLIWLTDSTEKNKDKLVINLSNKVIACENFDCLLEEALKIKSLLPDPINTSTWLNNVQGIEYQVIDYKLGSIEDSINSKTFNKKSIQEAINFINLCGDFDEQTGDQEIRTLRDKPNIMHLWEYCYNEIFWKEIGSNNEIDPLRLPELQTNVELLNFEMSQLLRAFLDRLEIIRR
jgi:hypothetical protein